jgi:hypothetical protein
MIFKSNFFNTLKAREIGTDGLLKIKGTGEFLISSWNCSFHVLV